MDMLGKIFQETFGVAKKIQNEYQTLIGKDQEVEGESFGIVKKIKKKYDDFKGRKQGSEGEKIYPNCCTRQINSYVKEGKLIDGGNRSGECGTVKDPKRVYCCKKCYGKYVRK